MGECKTDSCTFLIIIISEGVIRVAIAKRHKIKLNINKRTVTKLVLEM